MKRKIITTEDGSHTFSISGLPGQTGKNTEVTYHSMYGAIQESKHVFIEAGLKFLINTTGKQSLRVFEMGLGTGLNVLLSFIEAGIKGIKINYEAIDLYPLNKEEVNLINFCQQLSRPDLQPIFELIHNCDSNKEIRLSSFFTFQKLIINLLYFNPKKKFHLIYFDAFDPKIQPELWTRLIFEKLFSMLLTGGILVTYSSKGDVRRNMLAAGFKVEKIPGPPHKREILRAVKQE